MLKMKAIIYDIDQPWTLQPTLASMAALFASGWGISITAMLIYYSSRRVVTALINSIGASVASSTLYLI